MGVCFMDILHFRDSQVLMYEREKLENNDRGVSLFFLRRWNED